MNMTVQTLDGKPTEEVVQLDEKIFARPYSDTLVHQVITSYMAGARQGSKKNKNRSEVAGGGAKPWRQKGTGRARAGSLSSPIFRSGGVTFAARPKSWAKKVNRKMYRAAMQCIFSEFARNNAITVVDKLDTATPKTKEMCKLFPRKGQERVLFIADDFTPNFYYSVRNLSHVWLSDTECLDPHTLYQVSKVVITKGAMSRLEESYNES